MVENRAIGLLKIINQYERATESQGARMPANHGIYRKLTATPGQSITANETAVFRYGLLQIFQALKAGDFLTPEERQRAAQLEHHFRTVCQRFVFTLQELNQLMQDLALSYSSPDFGDASMKLHFQAECLADHVLTYLNVIVDDVAIVTALATGSSNSIDSMSKLKKHRSKPAFVPIKSLLDALDQADSWWELGFALKKGARQLLIHNQHLVGFQASSAPGGGEPFKVWATLKSPFAESTLASGDFFSLLRNLLTDLFAWFDQLEVALTSHLLARATGWSPMSWCPHFLLPVGYPMGVTRYEPDYFPLPLCNGSDSLPWTIQIQRQAD